MPPSCCSSWVADRCLNVLCRSERIGPGTPSQQAAEISFSPLRPRSVMNEDECVATDSIVLIFVVRLEVALLEIRELRGRHDFNRPCVPVSFRFPHSAFGPTLMIFISSLESAVYGAISVRGPGSNFRNVRNLVSDRQNKGLLLENQRGFLKPA